MQNTTVQYLKELDVAAHSLATLKSRFEMLLKTPVLDLSCANSLLKSKDNGLNLPFDHQLPHLDYYTPSFVTAVSLGTIAVTGSFTLTLIFGAISYGSIELRKRWVSERLESIMYRKQTKRLLHNLANHVKYLDALEVKYNAKQVKQLLYRAILSEQHLSGSEAIQLLSELWRSFVDNEDLKILRESAFNTLYVPQDFVPTDDIGDDDDEYLDIVFDDDDIDSVLDDAVKMEDRFSQIFGDLNTKGTPSDHINKSRFTQEVNNTSTEKMEDSDAEIVLSSLIEEKSQKTSPSEVTENPFDDVDDIEVYTSTSEVNASDFEDQSSFHDVTPDPAIKSEESKETESSGKQDEILESSLEDILSDEQKPASSALKDETNSFDAHLDTILPEPSQEEDNEPLEEEDEDIPSSPSDFFSSLGESDNDIPDMEVPDSSNEEKEDADGDLDSLLFALEDESK